MSSRTICPSCSSCNYHDNECKKIISRNYHDNECNENTYMETSTGEWISYLDGEYYRNRMQMKKKHVRGIRISSATAVMEDCSLETVDWNIEGFDLLIKTGNKLYPVHRWLLSQKSNVFKRKLMDDDTLIMELSCRPVDMKSFLRYLYNLRPMIDQTNVSEILVISKMFNVFHLEEECRQYLYELSLKWKKKKSRWRIFRDVFKTFSDTQENEAAMV